MAEADDLAGHEKVVLLKGKLGILKELHETLLGGGVDAALVRPPDSNANG